MEHAKHNNNVVIIITPEDIQAHGVDLGIDDITLSDAVRLLDEVFDEHDTTEMFININDVIRDHVQWAADGEDVNWDDEEEVAAEMKRKCLLNKKLKYKCNLGKYVKEDE